MITVEQIKAIPASPGNLTALKAKSVAELNEIIKVSSPLLGWPVRRFKENQRADAEWLASFRIHDLRAGVRHASASDIARW